MKIIVKLRVSSETENRFFAEKNVRVWRDQVVATSPYHPTVVRPKSIFAYWRSRIHKAISHCIIDIVIYLAIHKTRWDQDCFLHQIHCLDETFDYINDALVGEILVIVDDAAQAVPAIEKRKKTC